MMRLPHFTFHAPREVREAADLLASAAPGSAMLVAGGTDLLPNMKRRQQVPSTLISLRQVASLREISNATPSTELRAGGLTLGAGVTLTEVVRDIRARCTSSPHASRAYAGLWQAAAQVATPHLRNMGTIGGNLCLDTRCNYYDQNYEWRKAIDFCMKKDGETCWVALSSPRCLAVSSADTAPALVALGAEVTLVSAEGTRRLALSDLYRNDGIHYLAKEPDELLTEIGIPLSSGRTSAYRKLRRRGSFDFPVLSVGASVRRENGVVTDARIVLGAVSSAPVRASAAERHLIGRPLDATAIAEAAALASGPSRPMDNTDFSFLWRKEMTKKWVADALRATNDGDAA